MDTLTFVLKHGVMSPPVSRLANQSSNFFFTTLSQFQKKRTQVQELTKQVGYGSILYYQGSAGFSPCFNSPGQPILFSGPTPSCCLSLIAADPSAKSLTFCGFSGNPVDFPPKKVKVSKDPLPNSSQVRATPSPPPPHPAPGTVRRPSRGAKAVCSSSSPEVGSGRCISARAEPAPRGRRASSGPFLAKPAMLKPERAPKKITTKEANRRGLITIVPSKKVDQKEATRFGCYFCWRGLKPTMLLLLLLEGVPLFWDKPCFTLFEGVP